MPVHAHTWTFTIPGPGTVPENPVRVGADLRPPGRTPFPTRWDLMIVASVQDDGRTLKLFVSRSGPGTVPDPNTREITQ
jgi:hypothetical protein